MKTPRTKFASVVYESGKIIIKERTENYYLDFLAICGVVSGIATMLLISIYTLVSIFEKLF